MTDELAQIPNALTRESLRAAFERLDRIDYAEIAAQTAPDQPGGRIVFSTADYPTDEEADEALEDFFNDIMDRAHDRLLEILREKA